jgi:hypothetical protein
LDLDSIWMWLLWCVSLFASSVVNTIWGPSWKFLVLRKRRRWHLVRARRTGGIVPVWDRTCAYLDQLRDPFDLVKLETRDLSFNARILHPLCP